MLLLVFMQQLQFSSNQSDWSYCITNIVMKRNHNTSSLYYLRDWEAWRNGQEPVEQGGNDVSALKFASFSHYVALIKSTSYFFQLLHTRHVGPDGKPLKPQPTLSSKTCPLVCPSSYQ